MSETKEHYFQPEIECASLEEIRQLQNERLKKQVKNVWDNVPVYRERMEAAGVTPDDINTIDDLRKLPLFPFLNYQIRIHKVHSQKLCKYYSHRAFSRCGHSD